MIGRGTDLAEGNNPLASSVIRKACQSIVVLSLRLTAAEARAADPSRITEGKKYFAAGVALVNDPDGARYEDALVQFKKAFEALGAWKVLVNIAICSLRLERDGEAIEAYEKYLVAGGQEIDKSERADIERDLATLRVQVVRLHLELRASGGSIVDERMDARGSRIVNRYLATQRTLDLGVHPGHHVVTIQLGGQEARWEVDLAPGTPVNHTVEMSAAPLSGTAKPSSETRSTPDASSPVKKDVRALRIASFAALGVGAVGLGAGTAFALRSVSQRAQADDICPDPNRCPISQRDTVNGLDDNARSAKTFATVGFVVGGVAAGAGITLLVLAGSKQAPTAASPVEPQVRPWIGLGSLGVMGSF